MLALSLEDFNPLLQTARTNQTFSGESHGDLLEELESQECKQILAQFSDIFTRVNDLSLSLQGKNINTLNCHRQPNAFKDILSLLCRRVKRGDYSTFHHLRNQSMAMNLSPIRGFVRTLCIICAVDVI